MQVRAGQIPGKLICFLCRGEINRKTGICLCGEFWVQHRVGGEIPAENPSAHFGWWFFGAMVMGSVLGALWIWVR